MLGLLPPEPDEDAPLLTVGHQGGDRAEACRALAYRLRRTGLPAGAGRVLVVFPGAAPPPRRSPSTWPRPSRSAGTRCCWWTPTPARPPSPPSCPCCRTTPARPREASLPEGEPPRRRRCRRAVPPAASAAAPAGPPSRAGPPPSTGCCRTRFPRRCRRHPAAPGARRRTRGRPARRRRPVDRRPRPTTRRDDLKRAHPS
ncbi:hypothetical protein LT493_12355 [Streptomyces tricolor]|nr:hypothetical protein [Streptomyces tricolor]